MTYAAMQGRREIAALLITKGANVNTPEQAVPTPLMFAAGILIWFNS